MNSRVVVFFGTGIFALLASAATIGGCTAGAPDTPADPHGVAVEPPAPPAEPPAEPLPAPKCAAKAPAAANSLLMVQAWFDMQNGKPMPQPAKMLIWRSGESGWTSEEVLDEGSNVFHKAVVWRQGVLTIGAMGAALKHWKKEGDVWTSTTLFEKSWGGKFDRLRDLEIGDVNGDGKDDLVLATHDQGVVAVGSESDDGKWTFVEMDQAADRFVHEIEIGDVDGDGKNEFYATPSDRNRASMESQPGGVVRYDWDGTTYVRSSVAQWDVSHAKEILVADIDGDCTDELYAVREAHTKKDAAGAVQIIDPVRIFRVNKTADGWQQTDVASIDDKQMRFIVPGDVDGDGRMDLVAASMKKGLFVMRLQAGNVFKAELIDADSGGFEHATHVADLDGDGKIEIYVAADKQSKLNQYKWNGTKFDKATIGEIPKRHLTWNLQDGVL